MDISGIIDTYDAAKEQEYSYDLALSSAQRAAELAGTEAANAVIYAGVAIWGVIVVVWLGVALYRTKNRKHKWGSDSSPMEVAALSILVSSIILVFFGWLAGTLTSNSVAEEAYEKPEAPAGYDPYTDGADVYDEMIQSVRTELFTTYGVIAPEDAVREAFYEDADHLTLFPGQPGGSTENFGIDVDKDAKTIDVYRDGELLSSTK